MCDPPHVEPDHISEANSHIFLKLVLLKIKKALKISQLLMLPMKFCEIGSKTTYSGQNNEFNISGIGIFCETTSFLVIKSHEFHRSKSEKHFFQRFCASTKGTSFLLLYPEGAMFPSIFGRP